MSPMRTRLLTGVTWVAVETWGRHAALLVVFIILARHLGPETFGLAALAMVAPLVLAVPVSRGLPDALIQRKGLDPLHLDSAFWCLVGLGAAMSALILIFAERIALGFDEPGLTPFIGWAGVTVTLNALSAVPAAVLKRELHFRVFAVRTLCGTAVGGVVGIGLAIAGYGVWSVVLMQIAKASAETVVILGASAWRPRLRFSAFHLGQLVPFSGPLVVQAFWHQINDEIPKVVIGGGLGPVAVGTYALARRPLDLITEAVVGPLMAVTMPAVARVQSEPGKIDVFFNTVVRVAGIAGFPAYVGFAAVAPLAVPLVFGSEWTMAVPAVQILMLLGLQRTVDAICSFCLLALGHSALILKLNVVYSVVTVGLLAVAVRFGLEAALAALVLSNLLLLPVFLFLVRRIAGIDVTRPLVIFPRLALAVSVMFAAVTGWLRMMPVSDAPWLSLASAIAAGAAVYGVMIVLLIRPDLLDAGDLLIRTARRVRAGGEEHAR
ncbi:lipopolysaccharide biosynthesis protein [Chthonobacter rhizosphaerae]|uniref:lipopolysaccharide biosynthesis protein n=1 Tax=Chthonobacter rhizosphaerae TaxID=2735553 RepID=UPI0015EF478C|nr:lipopolysaccharide biosynthesis protein [Chthonobacter rhizosphaerae]